MYPRLIGMTLHWPSCSNEGACPLWFYLIGPYRPQPGHWLHLDMFYEYYILFIKESSFILQDTF